MSSKINKIIAASFLTLASIATIGLTSYTISNIMMERIVASTTANKLIGWTRENEKNSEARYLKDALLEDAIEKANTDSVLFYKITTSGVITRFSFVAHIMKVLELNPNKEIRIFAIKAINLDTSFFEQKNKFPNLKFNYFDESFIETYAKYDFNVEFLQSVYDEFGKDKKVDGYLDDFSFMEKVLLYVKGINAPVYRAQIYDQFALFAKLESINFFSDGTKSVEYFSEPLKRAFLLSNNLYDSKTSNYTNAKKMRERVKNGTISKREFVEGNNSLLFMTSLATLDFSNTKSSKYFLPTTDFIGEVNRVNNPNFKNGENDIFSPFNSVNLNVVSFLRSLNQQDIKKILKIKEDFDPNIYIQQMNNHINYVYAGSLLDNPDKVKANVDTLIAIRKYAQKLNPPVDGQPNKILVWFKGHPRDKDVAKKLRDRVIEMTEGVDNGEWIQVLDHQVPFEFYSIFNVFTSDPANNKEVYIFSSYSTLVMMMYAANQAKDIAKIIIDDSSIYSFDRIANLYGKDSKLFPEDKLTTLEQFVMDNETVKSKF